MPRTAGGWADRGGSGNAGGTLPGLFGTEVVLFEEEEVWGRRGEGGGREDQGGFSFDSGHGTKRQRGTGSRSYRAGQGGEVESVGFCGCDADVKEAWV